MGKPFKKEIEASSTTIEWAIQQNVDQIHLNVFSVINKPLYVVGSGGSLSSCHFAAALYQSLGFIAKAITPLELYYARFTLKDSKILFISSSGRNNDILFAFKMAIQNNANDITTICMRIGSPLTKLANSYSVSKGIEYDIPTKKDGFLATNSLTAFFVLLAKASGHINEQNFELTPTLNPDIKRFVNNLNINSTITVLFGGWATPIAFDVESKFTEAALGSILISDYRNFGHGRHHWFAKRKLNSSIIALITPEEKLIAEKTISFIPDDIPCLKIESKSEGPIASIELLIQIYDIVNEVGVKFNIDPGRPGVPDFGTKLYHLKYASFYKTIQKNILSPIEEISILRKLYKSSIKQIEKNELNLWREHFSVFIQKLANTAFTSIVFDFDGTLCSVDERFSSSLRNEVSLAINKLLDNGIIIGIATGRGKSVRDVMQNSGISKDKWGQIIIGYYNGAFIAPLSDNETPKIDLDSDSALVEIEKKFNEYISPVYNLNIKLRPFQLTIKPNNISTWNFTKKMIRSIVMPLNSSDLQLLESSHSIDIIVRNKASKLKVINKCIEMSKNDRCLTIGDKGEYPGNDYELLSTPYSLSVDEVSAHPESCWNLVPVGIKNDNAFLWYLNRITFKNDKFYFNL